MTSDTHAVFLAIAQNAQPRQGPSGMTFLLQMVAIFALFYFLFIRPQQKQRKTHEEQVRQIKRGDEIVTAGGIVGEVVHIQQGLKDGAPAPTLDDRITIKSGESRLIIERGRIARVITADAQVEEKAK